MTTLPANLPPPMLDERQTAILGIQVTAAMYAALACADTTYDRAGVSFVQDGRFTKAKYNGMTVASLVGRFNKDQLIDTIRSNIADQGGRVAEEILPVLQQHVQLPDGHCFGMDVHSNLYEVRRRGSRKLSAYIVSQTASPTDLDQVHAEFKIKLDSCSAYLIVKTGARLGHGECLLEETERTVTAETYDELGARIAEVFNGAVARRGTAH